MSEPRPTQMPIFESNDLVEKPRKKIYFLFEAA